MYDEIINCLHFYFYVFEKMQIEKKPHRRCPFCGLYDSTLSRHITRKHSDKERVKYALALPKRERIEMFAVFRNEGILNTNLKKSAKNRNLK